MKQIIAKLITPADLSEKFSRLRRYTIHSPIVGIVGFEIKDKTLALSMRPNIFADKHCIITIHNVTGKITGIDFLDRPMYVREVYAIDNVVICSYGTLFGPRIGFYILGIIRWPIKCGIEDHIPEHAKLMYLKTKLIQS